MYIDDMLLAIHKNETESQRTGIDYYSYFGPGRAKTGRPRKSDYLSESVRVYSKKGKTLAKQAKERNRKEKEAKMSLGEKIFVASFSITFIFTVILAITEGLFA